MFRVIHVFFDLNDNNHRYLVGDTFPHKGVEVDEDRIKELATKKNKLGFPLIEKVEDKPEETPKQTRKKKSES